MKYDPNAIEPKWQDAWLENKVFFEQKLGEHFPDTIIYWAYTSEIIRKKIDLPSLQKTFANVEADGYRKAVVQLTNNKKWSMEMISGPS